MDEAEHDIAVKPEMSEASFEASVIENTGVKLETLPFKTEFLEDLKLDNRVDQKDISLVADSGFCREDVLVDMTSMDVKNELMWDTHMDIDCPKDNLQMLVVGNDLKKEYMYQCNNLNTNLSKEPVFTNTILSAQSSVSTLKTELAAGNMGEELSDNIAPLELECNDNDVLDHCRSNVSGCTEVEFETLDLETELKEGTILDNKNDRGRSSIHAKYPVLAASLKSTPITSSNLVDNNEDLTCQMEPLTFQTKFKQALPINTDKHLPHGGVKDHTEEEPLRCTVCGKTFSNKKVFEKHLRTHTGKKPFKCTVCGMEFRYKSTFTVHLRIHTGEKPFECMACDRKFSKKGDLTLHLRIHTGEKPYRCTVCDRGFRFKGHLTKHLIIHTGEKPFKCTLCGWQYVFKSSLTHHLRTHTGGKPFKCTVCGMEFCHSRSLQTHLISHTGEKLFRCKECGSEFTRKDALQIHLRIHREKLPFKCKVCCEGFSCNSSLQSHLILHTGKGLFKCTVCDMGFSAKRYMKAHLRTHTEAKPYKCTKCGKDFIKSCMLKSHLRTHIEQKLFHCRQCGMCFNHRENLKEHYFSTHTVEKELG